MLSLLALGRTSKALRQLVFTRATGATLWHRALERAYAEGMPRQSSKLRMSPMAFTDLILSSDCSHCRRPTVGACPTIDIMAAVRLCAKCRDSQCVYNARVMLTLAE